MITSPEELAAKLESEDMETEIVTVSGALVIDSEYTDEFTAKLVKLFDEFVYLDNNYHLEVEDDQNGAQEL